MPGTDIIIDQAVGMMMARHSCDGVRARGVLREMASAAGTTVLIIAERLVADANERRGRDANQ